MSGRADSSGAAADDKGPADSAHAADPGIAKLEERAQAIREDLGELVDELDHRRHRVMKPLIIGATILGVAVMAVAVGGGAALWHSRRQRRPSRLHKLAAAFRRMADHPDRVAAPPPSSVGKKVLGAAAGALASVLVRRLFRGATSPIPPA